ncbi:hypothetical protein LINPERHAP2_LOCUS19569 [Linum perenne]
MRQCPQSRHSQQGTTVQGESHKNFIAILQSRIEVGSVYKITGFGLRPPRKSSRTSMFPHYLNLNPTTQFHLQPPTTPPFYVDSFGYIEFEELSARVHPPCATSQTSWGRGFEVKVSLWADLSRVVDATVFALEDESNLIIIAFGAFRITSFSGPRYRCTALIKNFENHTKWWYQACPHCFKDVAPNHDIFGGTVHESVLAAGVQYKYRLKLIVSYSTAEASFILLGMTAEKLLPISAVELVCAYPHAFGSFPSAIKFVIGQHVEFEVQLPKFSHSNHFGEFKICNISGLAIPHAEIIDNLPAPIAPKP